MRNKTEQQLSLEYKDCWQNKKPKWTYNIIPVIPVAGNNIDDMPIRLISYASSENISLNYSIELEGKSVDEQINRGRSKLCDKNYPLFRYSHISPFNRGDQFIITWFLLNLEFKKASNSFSNVAMDFAEQVSVSNTVKFTISRSAKQTNIDPNGRECFEDSVPYIINDLRAINPDVIVIPRTRFNKVNQFYGWKEIKRKSGIIKGITFLKMQQAVPQRINIDTKDPVDINVSKIRDWILNTRCKKTIERHLQWLKDRYSEQRDRWIEII